MGRAKEEWMRSLEPSFDHLQDDGFTPDIDLREVDAEEASQTIIEWFLTFFDDPAHETPYVSSEGGYLYIWGGPYDAAEQIQYAFAGLADEEAINLAIEYLEQSCLEWAPSSFHPSQLEAAREYHEEAESEWIRKTGPLKIFEEAEEQIRDAIGNFPFEGERKQFLMRMLYAQSYSIIESFLYDRLKLILKNNEKILINFCKNNNKLKKISYSPYQVILGKIDILKVSVEILEKEIFHRFDSVLKIYEQACDAEFQKSNFTKESLQKLESGLPLRHDCVHRNGHSHDGEIQEISLEKIEEILESAKVFVGEIEQFVESCYGLDSENVGKDGQTAI